MGDNSFDSMVTDPPAGISFMNKDWDHNRGGRDGWIYWMTQIMREAYRVLKPGAHAFVWAIPRTSHWTALSLERAGFEIRDIVVHLFGSGFPKSMDVSKAIDKADGKRRPYVRGGVRSNVTNSLGKFTPGRALRWQGYGTALKPASEHWILVRKPLSEPTVAKNVLKWGTGALNVDGCRVACEGGSPSQRVRQSNYTQKAWDRSAPEVYSAPRAGEVTGRFPANLVLSHSPDCVQTGMKRVKGSNPSRNKESSSPSAIWKSSKHVSYTAKDGTETVEAWECAEECPIAELDRQSGILKSGALKPYTAKFKSSPASLPVCGDKTWTGESNSGGASRFFYVAKASRSERNAGLEGMERRKTGLSNHSGRGISARDPYADRRAENHHPTVKPIALLRYLIRMITPHGGIVIDPFLGSGSTGVAARREGMRFVGIEKDPEYVEISKRRIKAA